MAHSGGPRRGESLSSRERRTPAQDVVAGTDRRLGSSAGTTATDRQIAATASTARSWSSSRIAVTTAVMRCAQNISGVRLNEPSIPSDGGI